MHAYLHVYIYNMYLFVLWKNHQSWRYATQELDVLAGICRAARKTPDTQLQSEGGKSGIPETNILLMEEIPVPTTWDGAKTL